MIPITQLYKHDPENGMWGDCWTACLASILELPREEVPHVYDKGVDGVEGRRHARLWLEGQGLTLISTVFMGSENLKDLMYSQLVNNPDIHYILGGESKNGICHAVVAINDRIVWDPAIDKSGIVGPCPPLYDTDPECGLWYVEYIGSSIALQL